MNKETLNKLLKRMTIIVGAIIILIIILVVVKKVFVNKNGNSISAYRTNIENASRKYYESLDSKLKNGESIKINVSQLAEKGYLDKDYKLENDAKCDGNVTIRNVNDEISYIVNLKCDKEYNDVLMSEYIKENTAIDSGADGLYNMNGKYVFRGDNANNFLSFAGKLWYIIDIDDSGIRITQVSTYLEDEYVWDDRYNSYMQEGVGYNDYLKSRIKTTIDDLIENGKIIEKKYYKYLVLQNSCIGARKNSETNNSGSVECSKVQPNQLFSTINVSDIINASLDSNCNKIGQYECSNYNYFSENYNYRTWTLNVDADNNYKVYYINNGRVILKEANEYEQLIFTAKLAPEVLYLSGDGSKENPYKIKEA